jgi:hypothetical protein
MAMGTGTTLAMPGEEPGEAGFADADRAAALWSLEADMGAVGLGGLVGFSETGGPIEPQMRVVTRLGSLTVGDLPADMRFQG